MKAALMAFAAVTVATTAAAAESLTLERAIDLALARNERVAAADARVEAAEATVSRARAFFFPDVNLSGTYTRRRYESTREIGGETVTIQSKNALGSTNQLTATLFNARAFPLYRQARLNSEGTRLESADEKRRVTFEAADAFIITLSLEQVLSAAGRRRDLAKATLEDARARFEAGLVSSNDVTRAELELATAERDLRRATGDVEAARLALGNLLDTRIEGPLTPPAQFLDSAAAPRSLSEAEIDTARERRFDLQAESRRVAALEEFAKEPGARFIPNLGLLAQHRYTNEAGLSGRTNDGFVSMTLNWNVFDGGEWRAERAERLALARAAKLELQERERSAETEVRTALARLDSERSSLEQANAAFDAARRNANETNELYRQGLASALELADANFRLFDSEVAQARARYQLALAYLDLRSALGLEAAPKEATP